MLKFRYSAIGKGGGQIVKKESLKRMENGMLLSVSVFLKGSQTK